MITKQIRDNILNLYSDKEEKIFVASLIDDIVKFETRNCVIHTKFLNINQKNITISILNKLDINYKIFYSTPFSERFVIFLIPYFLENVDVNEIFAEHLSCIKIIPKGCPNLLHKDYMGAIYSLGINENMIGDIFLNDKFAYVFIFNSTLEFIESNLSTVAKSTVSVFKLNINESEILELTIKFKDMNITIPSFRTDVILCSVFNLSRSEAKTLIEKGFLFINAKQSYSTSSNLNENDIISLRKHGKFKINKIIKYTKNNNIVLNIKKYT